MLAYRVFHHLPSALPGQPGHAEFFQLHHQGAGRWDNPSDYYCWYLATSPSGAIGEVFADLEVWTAGMFTSNVLPGAKRALGVYWLPDDLSILDLDDANSLRRQVLRPTQVVERNRPATQMRAKAIFDEVAPTGRRWAGLRWWSYHRPEWHNLALWGAAPAIQDVHPLTLTSLSVADAANLLCKRRVP